MKKFGTAALALALTGALAVPALAAETPVLISANPNAYSTSISLNGEKLDTAGIPGVPNALLPMRLLAEADHGNAYWDQENNQSWFTFGQNRITVDFDDDSVTVNDQPVTVSGMEVVNGVTFLTADVFTGWDGYTVEWAGAAGDGANAVTITTPNNDPMVKLAYAIMESSEMFGSRTYEDMLTDAYKIPADQFQQVVAFFPMITSPDTVIIGKLAEGADQKAVTDALEAYRQQQEDTFSWYLSQNLPKVQDARTVVENGYVLFFIGENPDEAEALFHSYVKAQG